MNDNDELIVNPSDDAQDQQPIDLSSLPDASGTLSSDAAYAGTQASNALFSDESAVEDPFASQEDETVDAAGEAQDNDSTDLDLPSASDVLIDEASDAEASSDAPSSAESEVAQPDAATAVVAESDDVSADDEQEEDAGSIAVKEFAKSLRSLEGKWYVLHTYSGYEKRVKTNVESRVQNFGLEDKVFQIEVPMEEVEKHTDKGKKLITRVRVPGYVLIRMYPDETARRIVRETEGVTGFVGPTKEPAPLSRKEVVSMLAPMIASEALKKAGDKAKVATKRKVEVSYSIGDQVTVVEGPFATMPAIVSAIEPTTQKLTVLVSIFGRDTPVELGFTQVERMQ